MGPEGLVALADVAPGFDATQLESVRWLDSSPRRVAMLMTQAWPGVTVKAQPALAAALVAAGGRSGRAASVLRLGSGLRVTPEAPDGGPAVVPYEGGKEHDLALLALAAYGQLGHPDAVEDLDQARAVLAGTIGDGRLGPLHTASVIAQDDQQLVAACIITRRPGTGSLGGPWLTHLMRHPGVRARGLGRTLLLRSLERLADSDEDHLTLAVTDGNPAHGLYRSLGAVEMDHLYWVTLP
jgi:ribosomal protein S18 acetylase RimI-like enzyme